MVIIYVWPVQDDVVLEYVPEVSGRSAVVERMYVTVSSCGVRNPNDTATIETPQTA